MGEIRDHLERIIMLLDMARDSDRMLLSLIRRNAQLALKIAAAEERKQLDEFIKGKGSILNDD